MEKIDRRITRTQKLLTDALTKLALRDGYDAVTIKDITDLADISYSTFFRHYPDKDALLMSVLEDTVDQLASLVGGSESAEKGGALMFCHVAENHALYQVLLGGQNSSAMVQKVQQTTIDSILKNYTIQEDALIPPEIAANHIAASALALVKWWLDNRMPYSAEQMGAIYATLIINPVHMTNR